MGGGHRGTADGVDGVLAANPGGLDVGARGEDVSALSIVGEVRAAVAELSGTDGDGLLGSSGGVVAGIGVVVAGGDSEVNTSIDGGVHNSIESLGLATTKRHVGDGALEALALAILGSLNLLSVGSGSPLNTLDNVGHGTGAVGAKNLDGVDVGLLGDTVLLASDGAGAVSAVTVAISILVTRGDGLSPLGTALEVDVVDVGAGVDNVGINTFTSILGVEVLVICAEAKGLAVGDTSQTPGGQLLELAVTLVLNLGLDGNLSVDNGVDLDELDL